MKYYLTASFFYSHLVSIDKVYILVYNAACQHNHVAYWRNKVACLHTYIHVLHVGTLYVAFRGQKYDKMICLNGAEQINN